MDWHILFPAAHQPSYTEIENYIGGKGQVLWNSLFDFMEKTYKAKPKMTYSVCSGKPGWNVKFQKSGTSFGTFYPEAGGFSVFMVIAYKLNSKAEEILPELTPEVRALYEQGNDFMKMGRYFMFRVENQAQLEDIKKFCILKKSPK